jgi:hypothetical protein
MGYCILCAIQLRLEIKELAELLGGKAGRNSLTLKKLLGGIFREAFGPNLLRSCNRLRALFLKQLSRNLIENRFSAVSMARPQECQDRA